jgi:NADH-quinone oxidoreductase subunit F
VTVHRGAGAYICGEETAMLNSIEGKRGEPRLKPPFPAVAGLYGMPTVVNNVETLAYLVPILERGAEWFASVGTERSKGYKIVSVSGHVQRPGNYEMPIGTPVREIIEIAGGLRPGRTFMAVQPGGGSSACIFEEHLDLPYDYESMAKAGSMLGSGAFLVMDDSTDFVKAAYNLVRFFAHESCGQCTPCREGGHWLEAVLERFVHHRGLQGDLDMLNKVSHEITGLNLCALGDSIEPFLASVLKRFPEQFEARVMKETVSA